MKRLFALAAIACIVVDASAAGSIYRCGREYQQTPCANGKMLDVSDPRSGAQRAEAKRVAEQERKQAAEMQRERAASEAAAKPASALGFNGRPPAPAASAASSAKHAKKKVKKAETTDFVAVEPKAKATK